MRWGIATICRIALFAATLSSSSMADAPKPSPLAEPKPVDEPGLPRDLYAASIPADNPQTPEKIALGKKLPLRSPPCEAVPISAPLFVIVSSLIG